jgi:predicted Fe-Mo cluster-binding NifX family protein
MSNKLIAIPTIKGRMCASLGRCEKFGIVEVNRQKILKEYYINPPAHQSGAYPKFLADYGVSVIIAGGLGNEAYQIFRQNNIEVFIGMCLEKPEDLVRSYLKDELKKGKIISEYLW